MLRLFVFILVVLCLGWSFAWLADRPGLISITWQDYLVETSLMVAAPASATAVIRPFRRASSLPVPAMPSSPGR